MKRLISGYARKCCIVFLALLAIPGQGLPSQDSTSRGRFVVFVVTDVRYQDISGPGLPNFAELLQTGASGLMSVRVGRSRLAPQVTKRSIQPVEGDNQSGRPDVRKAGLEPVESGSLSLGAGNLAVSTEAGRLAYSQWELANNRTAAEIYRLRAGRQAGDAAIIHLGVQELLWINRNSERRVRVGALGDALHKVGLKTAALGNSDGDTPHREAALICMDGAGLVDFGDVGPGMTRAEADAPFGMTADLDRLTDDFRALLSKSDLIVLDCGETGRVSRYAPMCTESHALLLKARALHNTDVLLGRVVGMLNPNRDCLILLAPGAPSTDEDEPSAMAPIAMWGKDVPRGLLTSSSTRRLGVVTNTDVAPTVLCFFDITRRSRVGVFSGRPIEAKRWDSPIPFVLALDRKIANQINGLPVARGAAAVQIGMVLLSLYLALIARPRWRSAVKWPALAPMAIMLALLWSGSAMQNAIVWPILAAVSALAVLAAAILLGGSPKESALLLMLTVAASIFFDLLRGSPLMGASVLGFSPAAGSRFYGLGNEMMGLLVGCCIAASVLMTDRMANKTRLPFLAVSGICLIAIVGLPFPGANFGGALAAAVGVGAGVGLVSGRSGWRALIWLAVAGLLAFGMGVGLDMARGGSSHIGRAFQITAQEGFGYLWEIAIRKLSLNLMLAQTSLWSKLLLAYMAAGALILALPGSPWLAEMRADAGKRLAITAVALAAAAAFVFNDSGVLAAATCLAPAWAVLITSPQNHFERARIANM